MRFKFLVRHEWKRVKFNCYAMVLHQTSKCFWQRKKCKRPSLNTLYKENRHSICKRQLYYASSWFLFDQTWMLCKINNILTKAWLMVHHANGQRSDWKVPISDNGWLWVVMQILLFSQAKAAGSPHCWHSEPRTSQIETSHTWAKNTRADNSLRKYDINYFRFISDSCLS